MADFAPENIINLSDYKATNLAQETAPVASPAGKFTDTLKKVSSLVGLSAALAQRRANFEKKHGKKG